MNRPAHDGPGPRTLVAGVGNIFLGDDGFGVEAVRALAAEPLPGHAEVADIGIRGVHLAYQLLDGYDTLVLVDATARGGAPGTLYVIEADATADLPAGGPAGDPEPRGGRAAGSGSAGPGKPADAAHAGAGPAGPGPQGGVPLDGHRMSPDAVLALLGTLCAGTGGVPPRRTLVVGCEPARVEEGIGLSPPVAAAVPGAVRIIKDILRDAGREAPAPRATAGPAAN
ncbi:hydrogenase maturation protease [Streptomyces sp. GC420]|uniref:hydrogenase maturation protease n=1 Tax=Streptomyces sp. GC420 TaxID=2697568 RepID=UPI0014151225|nr:hydrogenase maturation protease [Streptomyces sp. GC420]NBM18463.1 hydrogenase maturation protease [Streptomyces sp. GC420]